jgi:hypothetical protein
MLGKIYIYWQSKSEFLSLSSLKSMIFRLFKRIWRNSKLLDSRFFAFLHPIRRKAMYINNYRNFIFSLLGTAKNSNFIQCLSRKVWYLGNSNEFGQKLAVWTGDFFASLHPIRTPATYVKEEWNFAFSPSKSSEIQISFFA